MKWIDWNLTKRVEPRGSSTGMRERDLNLSRVDALLATLLLKVDKSIRAVS